LWLLAGRAEKPEPLPRNKLFERRIGEWHACLAREFAMAVQGQTSRAVAVEVAFGVCQTEERATIGSSGLTPYEMAYALTQAKAELKRKFMAVQLPPMTAAPKREKQPGRDI
jgi:hypothetical protein